MGRPIKKGSTDQSSTVRLIDASAFTPEQSVDHDTGGLVLWYRREGGSCIVFSAMALSALNSSHTDGGIEHIDDGYYRVDPPDAAFAAGANAVLIGGTVTDMIMIGNSHALVDYDPYAAANLGLSCLPLSSVATADALSTKATSLSTIVTAIKTTTDALPDSGSLSSLATLANQGVLSDLVTTVDGVVDAIKTTTDALPDSGSLSTLATKAAIGTGGSALASVPWNADWDAEVQSEVNDALVALDLDHLVAVADDDTPANSSIISKLAASDGDWSGFGHTTDSLEAIRDRGDAEWTTGGAADLEALSDMLTAVKAVTDELPDAGSLSTLSGLATSIKTTTDSLPDSGSLSSLATLANQGVLSDLITTVDGVVDAIKTTTDELPDSGSLSSLATLANQGVLSDLVTTVDTVVDAIKSTTDELPDSGSLSSLATLVGQGTLSDLITTVDTVVDAIKSTTDELPDSGSLSSLATAAAVAALNNVSQAQVNAQVVDALATDTYAEPGQGAPAATASLAAKINYLYKFLRNKIATTSTLINVYNDAGDTVDQKSTISDDGTTFTRGEFGSGE